MNFKLPAIALCILSVFGCASQNTNLGHGYKLVPRVENLAGIPGAFEGLAHYQDLFYRSRSLGQVGQYSIAPSGHFAIFEQNGKLVLFDARSQQTRDVTDGRFALPEKINWAEKQGKVMVLYYADHEISEISLK